VHICLITPSFPPLVDGGVAIATGRLTERLLARGHRVTVLTTTPPNLRGHTAARWTSGTGRFALCYGMVEDPLHAPSAVTDLCAWVRAQHQQQPFDVILAYFVYPSGYLATILGEQLRVPVVCSCRGNDIGKDMFIAPSTIATVLQHSTRLLFVSDSLLRMADTLVPCRSRATVVANAVDSLLFVPAAAADTKVRRSLTLGTSGIMRWKKGIDLLLPLIHRLCTLPEVRILIAGYGLDAAIDQQIADFLDRHDLHGRVEITGPLLHEQMVQALQRLDVYLNTSYQEGMPNGILEAMACALPVVATDADGIPQLVEDGVTGYLCRMGDLEALVSRCQSLLEQPALRRRMGRAGRQRVQQYFQPDHEAAAVEAVLRQACEGGTPPNWWGN
jgi:glycosyltransferase involved in cell wall biosynthesis